MANIYKVSKVIVPLIEGFEKAVGDCLEESHQTLEDLIREQLWCGVDGRGEYLSPSYDADSYFNEEGPWKGRAEAYKNWKARITPPSSGVMTMIAARPKDIPNLFIDGTFHSSIKAKRNGNGMDIYTSGFRDGPTIERKYGNYIFKLTKESKEFFSKEKLIPSLLEYYKKCGYKK